MKAGKDILLVKWVANRPSSYFQAQALCPAPLIDLLPPSNFIIGQLFTEDDWAPNLSPAFVGKYNVREFCRMLIPAPAYTPAPLMVGGGGGGAVPLVAPGLPAKLTSGTRGLNTRVNNLDYVASMFRVYADRRIANRSVRDLVSNGTLPALPPSKVPGANMCLAFHTKGYCNAGCGNRVDRVAYTEAELRPLSEWCASHYPAAPSPAAPAAAAATPGNA